MIMMQEPWIMKKEGDFISKSYPGFNAHIPMREKDTHPRAITFTRKYLVATQIFSYTRKKSDYCFVQVSGLIFVNVYRAPGPSGPLLPLLQ